MAQTFLPGWDATVSLNTEDLTVIGQVVSLTRERAVLDKPTFGSPSMKNLAGIKSMTFSANGHVSSEKVDALDAAFEAGEVAFELEIAPTTIGGTTPPKYSGTVVIGSYTIEADATDQWVWSVDASSTGDVTYAPATP